MNPAENETPSAPLAAMLAEMRDRSRQKVGPERLALMEGAIAELRASGIEGSALGVGAALPDLTLEDATGRPVNLRALNAAGPLVIVFYRGGWCPYCNMELRAWQHQWPALQRVGATLVAISPQTPDHSLDTAEKLALAFPVLSDSSLAAADAFGLSFTLPPALADLYRQFGNDLPTLNRNGRWALPIPATYLVAGDGRILRAHVSADYRERAEPAEWLQTLEQRMGSGGVAS